MSFLGKTSSAQLPKATNYMFMVLLGLLLFTSIHNLLGNNVRWLHVLFVLSLCVLSSVSVSGPPHKGNLLLLLLLLGTDKESSDCQFNWNVTWHLTTSVYYGAVPPTEGEPPFWSEYPIIMSTSSVTSSHQVHFTLNTKREREREFNIPSDPNSPLSYAHSKAPFIILIRVAVARLHQKLQQPPPPKSCRQKQRSPSRTNTCTEYRPVSQFPIKLREEKLRNRHWTV